jgi:hypothetical protein
MLRRGGIRVGAWRAAGERRQVRAAARSQREEVAIWMERICVDAGAGTRRRGGWRPP